MVKCLCSLRVLKKFRTIIIIARYKISFRSLCANINVHTYVRTYSVFLVQGMSW